MYTGAKSPEKNQATFQSNYIDTQPTPLPPPFQGSSELYASKLKEKYLGDVPIYSPFYGSTEGLIGVNLWPQETTPVYMLVPRAMFFEFIPVEESSQEQPKVRRI